MIWAEDFATEKGLEKTEYFVYCGFFKTNFWGERFVQIPKGEFLEVPNTDTLIIEHPAQKSKGHFCIIGQRANISPPFG